MPDDYRVRSLIRRDGTSMIVPTKKLSEPAYPGKKLRPIEDIDERMVLAIVNNDLETIAQLLVEFVSLPLTKTRRRILEGIKGDLVPIPVHLTLEDE